QLPTYPFSVLGVVRRIRIVSGRDRILTADLAVLAVHLKLTAARISRAARSASRCVSWRLEARSLPPRLFAHDPLGRLVECARQMEDRIRRNRLVAKI